MATRSTLRKQIRSDTDSDTLDAVKDVLCSDIFKDTISDIVRGECTVLRQIIEELRTEIALLRETNHKLLSKQLANGDVNQKLGNVSAIYVSNENTKSEETQENPNSWTTVKTRNAKHNKKRRPLQQKHCRGE
nr:unnamed protein product [Callosobruchus analis]